MKIGYPCINRTISCTSNSTFRLKNYSIDLLKKKIKQNLECLEKTLIFNKKNELLFFRIGSGLIPFASHNICKFDWQDYFSSDFKRIGSYIKKNDIRISMHPDQFVVLNAMNNDIVKRSINEIKYHCDVLDVMKLNNSAKVQIHVGGVYGNKQEATKRFIENYSCLDKKIKNRLVIENDDHLFSAKDCLSINKKIKIPIVFDSFHHECLNNSETFNEILEQTTNTWKNKDGIQMIDYSSQYPDGRKGRHVENINMSKFNNFIRQTKEFDYDIMLEIKDKEISAIKAFNFLRNNNYL